MHIVKEVLEVCELCKNSNLHARHEFAPELAPTMHPPHLYLTINAAVTDRTRM